jgi:hypothetical protein
MLKINPKLQISYDVNDSFHILIGKQKDDEKAEIVISKRIQKLRSLLIKHLQSSISIINNL